MGRLNDDVAAKAIPASLLTGFLGSGKTTVLNHLLRHPEFSNAVVIVNEFGEVGLDHDLIEASSEDMILLQSGCLCCTIRCDLIQTLHALLNRRERGVIKPFDRLIIETTGLADPAPILHTFITDRLLSLSFRVDGVIVTVDAAMGEQTLDSQFESVKQAAVADRLVLTKTDLVSSNMRTALEKRLRTINPGAHILVAHNGVVDPAELLDFGLFDPSAKNPDVAKWLNVEAYRGVDNHAHGEDRHGHHDFHDQEHDHRQLHSVNRHSDHISALCLTVSERILPEALDQWLETIIRNKGPDILRIKAVIHVLGIPLPLVIQGVQHIFHPPVMLRTDIKGEHTSRIVVIGRDLDEDYLRNSLFILLSSSRHGKLGS